MLLNDMGGLLRYRLQQFGTPALKIPFGDSKRCIMGGKRWTLLRLEGTVSAAGNSTRFGEWNEYYLFPVLRFSNFAPFSRFNPSNKEKKL